MYLQKISEADIYYLSATGNGLGDLLIYDTLPNILSFTETTLINNNTDFQPNAVFKDLGTAALVAETDKWYALELSADLYQIILTDATEITTLPDRQKWTGSLNDLIGFLYQRLTRLNLR